MAMDIVIARCGSKESTTWVNPLGALRRIATGVGRSLLEQARIDCVVAHPHQFDLASLRVAGIQQNIDRLGNHGR